MGIDFQMDIFREVCMKVKDCVNNCAFYERRTWSQYYVPTGYHPVGFTHAYGFCRLYDKRCAHVSKCEILDNINVMESTDGR